MMTSYPQHTQTGVEQYPHADEPAPWQGPRHRHPEAVHTPGWVDMPWSPANTPAEGYPTAPGHVPHQRTSAVYVAEPHNSPPPPSSHGSWPQIPTTQPPGLAKQWHKSAPTTAAPVWPMPHDARGQRDGVEMWRPMPTATELVTPIFRGILVSRLVTASVAHANHVLDNLGVRASEPGPHALLLLSAQPVHREPLPERPSWYSPPLPQAEEPPPTALIRVASRLVGIGDGDDLLPLLSELTAIASANIATAAAARKLLHQHDHASLASLAGRLTLEQPWTPPAPFPYAQALAQGELWDPRMPHTGIAPTSKEHLTPDVAYLGVAVTTLDTPTDRWVDVKAQWRGARDPERGLPVTAGSLPGAAWAVLEDGTAMHIDRTPESLREARTHTVVSNAPVERGFDRIISISYQRRLVQDSPPRLPRAGQPAQRTAELWQHLAGLHTALRTAFGYEVTQ